MLSDHAQVECDAIHRPGIDVNKLDISLQSAPVS